MACSKGEGKIPLDRELFMIDKKSGSTIKNQVGMQSREQVENLGSATVCSRVSREISLK